MAFISTTECYEYRGGPEAYPTVMTSDLSLDRYEVTALKDIALPPKSNEVFVQNGKVEPLVQPWTTGAFYCSLRIANPVESETTLMKKGDRLLLQPLDMLTTSSNFDHCSYFASNEWGSVGFRASFASSALTGLFTCQTFFGSAQLPQFKTVRATLRGVMSITPVMEFSSNANSPEQSDSETR